MKQRHKASGNIGVIFLFWGFIREQITRVEVEVKDPDEIQRTWEDTLPVYSQAETTREETCMNGSELDE